MASPDPLTYTYPFQLTKTIRRDPYDVLSPTKPENSAAGKIILITGGGTGIGAAAGHVWAKAGAEGVVLAGRRVEMLEKNAEQIRAAYPRVKVLCVGTDLLKDGDVKKLFQETLAEFGGRAPDVVLANAGVVEDAFIGEQSTDAWWDIVGVNLKGAYATAHHFIQSQANPKEPVGTFIITNSGLAGLVEPGMSAYSIAKLGSQRLIEYLQSEYPSLRPFTMFPGVVKTPMMFDRFEPFALDHADLTGATTSVNWDIEEMEANKDRIVEEDLLKIKWMPILPASGGRGL